MQCFFVRRNFVIAADKQAPIAHEVLVEEIEHTLEAVREQNPLVGSLTNTVTIDFVANAQLAIGGSAAMVYLPDEAEALVTTGGAFYLNMGTLLPLYEQTVPRIAQTAVATKTPWVLDPVGLGIGSLRTKLVSDLKIFKPTIIRGNASEIIALASLWQLSGEEAEVSRAKGVDSADEVDDAREAAICIARYTGGAVVVSGETDLVTDGSNVALVEGGSPLMGKVTGFGCSQGGVLAVYAAVARPFAAALAGVAHYKCAGTKAAGQSSGPASFKVAFIDALYQAAPADVASNPFEVELA